MSLPLHAQPDDFKLGHWLFLKLKVLLSLRLWMRVAFTELFRLT